VSGGRGTTGIRAAAATLVALLLLAVVGLGSPAVAGPGGVRLDRIGNFNAPVYVDNAPGFGHLLFVVELRGTIAVLRDGRKLGHPFLDIRGLVSADGGERGLFSVAFPEEYSETRPFYVFYTNRQGAIEIDEFKRSRNFPALADKSSRREVMVIRHPERNHYGGQLQFGPDGRLYAATGDGGGASDSHDNARHLGSLLGKLLRIDPRRHGDDPYRSPASNPYVGAHGRDEVYAYGLRNPWRFSIDPASGNIAIADVGEYVAEEVNYETLASAKGANFGWPEWEGRVLHDPSRPGRDPAEPPIFSYRHASCRAITGACAITGGYLVRDPRLSTLTGRYLYADFYVGDIRSFIPSPGGATDDRSTGLHVTNLSSFGQGLNGRMYAASLNGPVYRLKPGG
jgi:glucose/sorbosone dehydrogenase